MSEVSLKAEKSLTLWKEMYQLYQAEPEGKKKDKLHKVEYLAWQEMVDTAWEAFHAKRKK